MWIKSLLPPNSTNLERQLEKTQAKSTALPVDIDKLMDPQTCPAHLLPYLAYSLSVETWNSGWNEATKRAVIADYLKLKLKRGSVGQLRTLLAKTGVACDIKEWFNNGGPVHTFSIVANVNRQISENNNVLIDRQRIRAIRAIINRNKPVRSHFDFSVAVRFRNGIQVANAITSVAAISRQKATVAGNNRFAAAVKKNAAGKLDLTACNKIAMRALSLTTLSSKTKASVASRINQPAVILKISLEFI